MPQQRRRVTRVVIAYAMLMTGIAIGVSVAPQVVQASAVTLPTPSYTVSVDGPCTGGDTPVKYTGRGSWTNVELLNGQLAVPLFRVGSDENVPFRTAICVGGLESATKIRAALDGVALGNGTRGDTETERAAITAYVYDCAGEVCSWGSSTGTFEAHGGYGSGNRYLGVSDTGAGWVKFVVDLYCRDTNSNGALACDEFNGLTPGGTNLIIEVEGSGDGVYNSGYANAEADDVTYTSITKDGSSATLNGLAEGHGLQVDHVVSRIVGGDGCFSRSFRVTAVTATSATIENASCVDTGGGAVRRVARGDEAYEVVLSTDAVRRFVDGDFVNGLTTSKPAFVDRTGTPANYRQWTGLMGVPACGDASDTGPCLEAAPVGTDADASPTYTTGWSVMLLDDPTQGRFTIRPWRSAHPYYVMPGTSVSFSLRLPASTPQGDFRDWVNAAFEYGLSSAFSSAQINSFGYTAGDTYHTVALNVTAREMSKVTRFDVTSSGDGTEFFVDYCTGRLRVAAGGIVYIDVNENNDYDDDEEEVSDCQNETSGFAIDRVVLWGDSAGNGDRAWMRAPGHDFAPTNTVTVCCAFGAFDGAQTVVAVGNPYGASDASGGPNDWFAFDTSSGLFDNQSFPRADGSENPGWEVVIARAVERNYIRVTASSVTLDVSLRRVGPECSEADCGFFIPSNQHIAGGFISTNAQAFAFGPAMDSGTPAFDFGVAGPSRNAAGTLRTTDGFFRACIPARFLTSKFGGLAAATAAAQINGRSASSTANRNGALVATTATCGEAGGVLARLDQFGFSAPYFAIRPVADTGGGGEDTTTTTAAPTTTTTTTVAPTTTTTVVPTTTVAPTTTLAPTTTVAPPTTAAPPATVARSQVPGPGRPVEITTSPPAQVASAVGVKVAPSTITLALARPQLPAAQRPASYTVTLVRVGSGIASRRQLSPARANALASASFGKLSSGRYQVIVLAKNANGRTIGRWKSPTVRVTNKRN